MTHLEIRERPNFKSPVNKRGDGRKEKKFHYIWKLVDPFITGMTRGPEDFDGDKELIKIS